ncbi:hypothetical protein DEAC_c10340 [Desulfosporosinus acididurans]|uniref:Uncharacterized protein n=1 Tax=Desulfosporosinus acididurans TaxID=476652 RepID=A0A0J1FUI8_9FIRM|nr:hypothetical protein DEAC_c10340 [Desulfosporosinus acididurans]
MILVGKLLSRVFGSKNDNQDSTQDSNQGKKDSAKIKIPYTKEFPYVPSYHWVQAFEFTPATSEEPLAKAKYLIHKSKDTVVYEAYKAILVEDGWTITEETKVINFVAQKDNHIANISFSIFEENVLLTILAN